MKVIPTPIQKFVSDPRTAEFVENTIIAVGTETALKMIGRPTFIFLDKEADDKKKKFAALKEFLYQTTCLGLYLTIVPAVKELSYKALSYILSKNPKNKESIDMFNKEAEVVKQAKKRYTKSDKFINRLINGKKDLAIKKAKEAWKKAHSIFEEKIQENSKLHLGKGCHELGAVIGSVITLAIIAPEISHFIVHPLMKFLGFEHPYKNKKN